MKLHYHNVFLEICQISSEHLSRRSPLVRLQLTLFNQDMECCQWMTTFLKDRQIPWKILPAKLTFCTVACYKLVTLPKLNSFTIIF